MQLPNPPWYRRWSVILAGVIGVAAITAMLGWRGLQQVASPSTTTTPPATAPGPATATTGPAGQGTTTTRPPGVLWTRSGSDVGRSPGFRAPSGWRIEWSFDCSNFRKFGGGNFKISGGGAFSRVQVQEFDVEASGSRTFTRGGYGHLVIDSVCRRWTVTVLAD